MRRLLRPLSWRCRPVAGVVLLAAVLAAAAPATAQTTEQTAPPPDAADRLPVTLEIRSFIYADNTEFLDNPYRLGETLLGEQIRAEVVFPLSKTARFMGGFHSNSYAGDDRAFEKFKPVVALELESAFGTVTLGTLRSGQLGREVDAGLWPEESGPHGLLPVIQVDTLTMTRSYEAGAQLRRTGRVTFDGWLAWQKLNTSAQRERIDGGFNGRARLAAAGPAVLFALAQVHVVHEGGQLFHVGEVGDSVAGAWGAGADVGVGPGTFRVEAYGLFAKHDPVRGDASRRLDGTGALVKLAYDYRQWHGLFMTAGTDRFVKWEGDPNYAGLTTGGGLVPSRDYTELSVSRRIPISNAAQLLTNLRFYRIDGDWDYAYRIAAAIRITQPLRRRASAP